MQWPPLVPAGQMARARSSVYSMKFRKRSSKDAPPLFTHAGHCKIRTMGWLILLVMIDERGARGR